MPNAETKPEVSLLGPGAELENKTSTLLGGDSMIEPKFDKSGRVESYVVKLIRDGGENVSFLISKEQGQDLITARIAIMASEVAQDRIISEEAFQSLIPTYVAKEYRIRLLGMGIPEDKIPQTTSEMVAKARQELEEYRELGKEQIASAAQHIADQILEISSEVFAGNNFRYNQLPKEFKEIVKFHLPSFSALAAQHSGINEETMEAQRRALALNLMSQEQTRDAVLSYLPAIAGAGADTIATFLGNLLGTTRSAAESAYTKIKERRVSK
ncbi:TPA: hypothetical protein DIU27_03760 [Candidatus Collierbacteria bacterium]|uniref:Uncharacterized protein n=1 Tax=Candidatus Collierbacteria bacterium GW2011_GWB2_44_22 TaxID=1618387 RepID=A0A0G1K7N1_9BACT|nr:MAG: hypothetical protein UW31_C0007G0076 [Candidatus Collierbacteria bacterium GW2011_GWA2_44_13]KKT50472.1 MAG: hypothetical protein UW42_C0018G0012 [Candidatus Collierbacteria bacterium GW2011_GWB1_44_197]KKT52307.1 MAG: hypothetical protein UW44_C0003G0150 [Candidatus Collierbacteria bacterium GW2011_GWB2_44_22]KKT63227.1 MAG: hypothetical protein UW56_C0001G0064 [Candidatus Collierbacteria bacterium GW2011_GWD1_44_27]KKT65728.1 MAG: hypothetical protein UW58_C0021G0006 [Candidatus Colli